MKYHGFQNPSHLFISLLAGTCAFVSQATSLQRRRAEPGLLGFSCCTASIDTLSYSASDLAGVPKTPAGQAVTPAKAFSVADPDPVADLEVGLKASDEQAGPSSLSLEPYPTQLKNPKFSPDGFRYRAGAIGLHPREPKVLLIRDKLDASAAWRFPEGDWAQSEEMFENAVVREAYDTAGLYVDLSMHFVGTIEDTTATAKTRSHFYRFHVTGLRAEWPGQARWMRKWTTYDDAAKGLKSPGQLELLAKIRSMEQAA